MREVVVVSACRTAIGTFRGALKDVNAAALASVAMKEAGTLSKGYAYWEERRR